MPEAVGSSPATIFKSIQRIPFKTKIAILKSGDQWLFSYFSYFSVSHFLPKDGIISASEKNCAEVFFIQKYTRE